MKENRYLKKNVQECQNKKKSIEKKWKKDLMLKHMNKNSIAHINQRSHLMNL